MSNTWIDNFFYSPKYDYGFYNINKNASQSITQSIKFVEWPYNQAGEVMIFCVIRDILDRFVSILKYCKKLYRLKQFDFLLKPLPDDIEKLLQNPDLFLDHIIKSGFWDVHQVPQAWFLNGRAVSRHRRIDHVTTFLNFHRLAQDIKIIGKGIRLKKINTQSKENPHKGFIKRRKDDIIKLYECDIKLMGMAGI